MNAQRLTKSPRPNAVHSAHSAAKSARGAHGVGSVAKSVDGAVKSARGAHGVGSAAKSVGSAAKLIDKGTWCKRLSTLVLTLCLIVTMAPIVAAPQTAQAASATDKAIVLGTADLHEGWRVSSVYFGRYQQTNLGAQQPTEGTQDVDWIQDNSATSNGMGPYYSIDPIKWRVLSTDNNRLFLLADQNLNNRPYNNAYADVTWATSPLRAWLNQETSDGFLARAFSDEEQKYVLTTDLANNAGDPTQDKIFCLSIDEVNGSVPEPAYFRRAENTNYAAGKNTPRYVWWLRSRGFNGLAAAVVNNGGSVSTGSNYLVNEARGVRPGFNLNASSILFTAPAVNGKSKNVSSTLPNNADYISGEHKLTLKDDARNGFRVTQSQVSGTRGDVRTLNYTGAQTGANEYLSAMIVDTSNSNDVLYYGQIKQLASSGDANGTVDVAIPSDIEPGTNYALYLFNEQINGDRETDYASDFANVALEVIPTTPQANDFTFNAPSNTIYDGTAKQARVAAKPDVEGMGNVTVKYFQGNQQVQPIDVGTYTVKIDLSAGRYYFGATDLTDPSWQFSITKANSQTTTTSDNATVIYGDTLTLTAEVARAPQQQQSPIRRAPQTPAADKVSFYLGEGENAALLDTVDVQYADANRNDRGTATITIDTKNKQLQPGANIVTAQYGGSVNLNSSGSSNITVTLEPKTVGLSWSGAQDRIYNGQPSNVTAAATGTLLNDTVSVAVTGGNQTDARTHAATATGLSGAQAGYYKLPDGAGATRQYVINPKPIDGATVGSFEEMNYFGTDQTPVAEVTIDGLKATGTWSEVRNVSDKTTFTASGNFTGEIKDKETGMKPKNIAGAHVGNFDPMTYTGASQIPSATVSVDGIVGGANVPGSWSAVTNVSDTTTFTTSGNFEGTIANRPTGMNQLPVEIEWDGTEGLTYDGTEKEITARLVNKVEGDMVNLIVDGNKQTGKGIYRAEVTSVDNPNYTLTGGKNISKEWSIAEALNVFTSGPSIADWTFGAAPSTPTATTQFGTPTFTYSNDENGAYAATIPTSAGNYWMKATVEGTEHYAELVSNPVPFSIDKASPKENAAKRTTAKSFKGKPLSQAVVTEGEMLDADDKPLTGTFAWENGNKTVAGAGNERMTFAPVDANYASVTFNVAVNIYSLDDVNLDTDGDGKPDINIDTNGDGKPDLNIDVDGDGTPDINIVDKDGDGKPDTGIDPNSGTKPDVNIDTNGDNKPDLNVDTDGDGIPDINIVDKDGDGKPDKGIDPGAGVKPDLNIDTNGDGKADLNIDTNGDGKPDLNIDVDGDGVADLNIDTDGDGKPDKNIDADGDGKVDRADSKSTTKTTTTTTTTSNVNGDNNTSASPQSGDTPWPWAVAALALISAVVGAGALSARTIRSYRAAYAGKHSAPRRRH